MIRRAVSARSGRATAHSETGPYRHQRYRYHQITLATRNCQGAPFAVWPCGRKLDLYYGVSGDLTQVLLPVCDVPCSPGRGSVWAQHVRSVLSRPRATPPPGVPEAALSPICGPLRDRVPETPKRLICRLSEPSLNLSVLWRREIEPDPFRSRPCRLGSSSPTLRVPVVQTIGQPQEWLVRIVCPRVCVRIESEGRRADARGTFCCGKQNRPNIASRNFVAFHLRRNYASAGKDRLLSTSDRQLLDIPSPRRETCPISAVGAAIAA